MEVLLERLGVIVAYGVRRPHGEIQPVRDRTPVREYLHHFRIACRRPERDDMLGVAENNQDDHRRDQSGEEENERFYRRGHNASGLFILRV